MTDWQLNTPVVFIIFNRTQATKQVFEAIRRAKPPQLFVIADGPRANKPGEAQKCAAAREITEQVDWDCEVFKNYSDTNLGCGLRPASGLDWVFEQVEEAIVLEDDCLPHPSFFRYCEALLNKYRHDERVMAICGSNLQFGSNQTDYSYYFSHYSICWGWASWRRAWQFFDFNLKLWPEIRDKNLLIDILQDEYSAKIWHLIARQTWEKTLNGSIPDCWDYQWTFSNFIHHGLSIVPNNNLIANIGYTDEATHTFNPASRFNQMSSQEIILPLTHPPYMVRNVSADLLVQNTLYDYRPKLTKKIRRKLKQYLKI